MGGASSQCRAQADRASGRRVRASCQGKPVRRYPMAGAALAGSIGGGGGGPAIRQRVFSARRFPGGEPAIASVTAGTDRRCHAFLRSSQLEFGHESKWPSKPGGLAAPARRRARGISRRAVIYASEPKRRANQFQVRRCETAICFDGGKWLYRAAGRWPLAHQPGRAAHARGGDIAKGGHAASGRYCRRHNIAPSSRRPSS